MTAKSLKAFFQTFHIKQVNLSTHYFFSQKEIMNIYIFAK